MSDMAIPAVTCARCGAEGPTEVIELYTYHHDDEGISVRQESYSICKKCRKSFRRWLRRLERRNR